MTGYTNNFLDVQLVGPVGTRSYEIGSGAARLGSVTLMPDDWTAALSFGFAAIVLRDVVPLLGPQIPRQLASERSPNVVTACVRMIGRQLIKDFEAVPANRALDRCGFARFRFGSIRLAVRDRDAASAAADALTASYGVAAQSFGNLPDLTQIRAARDTRRQARIQRRPLQISTPNRGLLAPAPPLMNRRGDERVL